ncbi:MAG: hypothetical protein GWP50_10540 [Proteobacteria bacterium]|nr:hypothetical protein [Pseudomonadota bacterium]
MVSLCRLLTAILLFGSAALANAELSTRLSSDTVEELESLRLAIRDHGARQTKTLDLTELQKDFHIMGNNTSNQYQHINGRTQSWVDYQITLQPKRTGTLAIPSIQVGKLQTEPLTVTVTPLPPSTRQKIDELVFYEQRFSTLNAYVQSQILMQRQLFYSNGVQLYGGQPAAPEITNAVVVTLGENRASTVQRNGKTYGVVTQNYAIFPESSGALTVPAVEMTASVRVLNNGRVSRKGVRVGTEPKTIKVLPVPDNYPKNTPWLPATEVTLTQSFDRDIRDRPIQVGDSFTQAIQIKVKSNTGSIVPPLTLSLPDDQFREYPETPILEDDTLGPEVVGRRIEKRSLIALKPGVLTLPGNEIVWWNTATRTVQRTSLASVQLTTEGAAIAPKNNEPLTASSPKQSSESETEAPSIQSRKLPALIADTVDNWLREGLIRSVGFILTAILITWLSWRYTRAPHRRKQRALERSRKRLLAQISNRDISEAQQSLSKYLHLRYGSTHKSVRQAWISEQPNAAVLIALLDKYSYDQVDNSFPADEAKTLAKELLKRKVTMQKQEKRSASLPALYPTTLKS